MNKKTIILSIAIVGLLGSGSIFAQTGFSDRMANRFNLNPNEVRQFMGEQKQEMIGNRLDNAVENGKITEEQKILILEKHEEMRQGCEGLRDIDPEARKEAMQERHEEMKQWAEENGISLGRGFAQFRGLGR